MLKRVLFEEIDTNRYNLALSDFINGEDNYENITDNKDLELVLGTIGAIVLDFTETYPQNEVLITGNTAVKRRMYRMQVSNNLEEIQKIFNVFGAKEETDEFEEFKKGENYLSILVSRK